MAEDTDRAIGIVIGKLDAMEARMDRADQSRAATHQRIDGISADMSQVKADVATVKADIHEIKPEVALVRDLRFKAWGAVLVLGAIGAILWSVITTFGAKILGMVK